MDKVVLETVFRKIKEWETPERLEHVFKWVYFYRTTSYLWINQDSKDEIIKLGLSDYCRKNLGFLRFWASLMCANTSLCPSTLTPREISIAHVDGIDRTYDYWMYRAAYTELSRDTSSGGVPMECYGFSKPPVGRRYKGLVQLIIDELHTRTKWEQFEKEINQWNGNKEELRDMLLRDPTVGNLDINEMKRDLHKYMTTNKEARLSWLSLMIAGIKGFIPDINHYIIYSMWEDINQDLYVISGAYEIPNTIRDRYRAIFTGKYKTEYRHFDDSKLFEIYN